MDATVQVLIRRLAWATSVLTLAACSLSAPPRPVDREALTDLGYAWPPGELLAGGLCSIGDNGETGIVGYRTRATAEDVAAFYDRRAARVRLEDALSVGHSVGVDGQEIGAEPSSTAWRLDEQVVVIATPERDTVRLLARFEGAVSVDCNDAYPDPAP